MERRWRGCAGVFVCCACVSLCVVCAWCVVRVSLCVVHVWLWRVQAAANDPRQYVMLGVNNSVMALVIKNGAHHLDLMFSDDRDPSEVVLARALELKEAARWVAAAQQTTLV